MGNTRYPTLWGEAKKARLNLLLTETGKQGLQALADKFSLSINELLEQIGRGVLTVSPPPVEPQKNEPPLLETQIEVKERIREGTPIACPHCGEARPINKGKRGEKQRWQCRACKKSWSA